MAESHQESGVSARRAATRARLVDAATTVFAREGLRGATVEQICDEAGFTRGAFYSNFESKDELITALMVAEMGQVHQSMSEAVETAKAAHRGGDLHQMIEQVAQLFVAMQPTRAELVLTLSDLRLEAARSSQVRESFHAGRDAVRNALRALVIKVLAEYGLQFRIPAGEALDCLDATYNQLTLEAVTDRRPPSSPDLARRLTDLMTVLIEPIN